jgi:signal transduction histidine kinase
MSSVGSATSKAGRETRSMQTQSTGGQGEIANNFENLYAEIERNAQRREAEQRKLQELAQETAHRSNILKTFHDMMMAVISNMKL